MTPLDSFMKNIAVKLLVLLFVISANAKASSAAIDKKIAAIAQRANCTVGVSAIHIESQQKIGYNDHKPFFMASTVKVPIALALLARVDENKDHLERMVKFTEHQGVPGSGSLYAELYQHPSTRHLALKELLSRMLMFSDNTATDIILHEVNGPTSVLARLHAYGFSHIRVNRSIYDLYLASSGLCPQKCHYHSLKNLEYALDHVHYKNKIKAWQQFQSDSRDTTTPRDMALLLTHLYQGKIVSPKNTQLLLHIMANCQTGKNRIRGLLPPNTIVAHKTGTWALDEKFRRCPGTKTLSRYTNDAGIITLPHHKGHVALAIYVRSKGVADPYREAVIARISRVIYDHFS